MKAKSCYHLTEKERTALIQKRLPLRVLCFVLNKWEGRQTKSLKGRASHGH